MSDKIDMLFSEIQEMRKDIKSLMTDVTVLKTKSAIIASVISVSISVLIAVLASVL